jgi:hypothetical protein
MKRKVVFKGYSDFEKEERWLNEMAAKGLDLVGWYPYIYLFETGEPGAWTYRSGVLPHPDSRQYREFMADAGVETVAAFNRAAIFRKRTVEGPFELFSDTESRIAHYQSIRKRWFYVGWLLVLPFAALNLVMSRLYSPLEMAPLLLVELSGISVVIVQAVRVTKRLRALEAERLLVE